MPSHIKFSLHLNGRKKLFAYKAIKEVSACTGAPKLINSDLFLEKRATVPIKNTRCATIELRENVHVLKRGRFLHDYTETQPKISLEETQLIYLPNPYQYNCFQGRLTIFLAASIAYFHKNMTTMSAIVQLSCSAQMQVT